MVVLYPRGKNMKIIPFYARGWESNSYLVISGGQAALIDAGVSARLVLEALEKENAVLKYILLTHGHFDHTITADALRDATEAKLVVHELDAEMLTDAEKSALAFFTGRKDTVKLCEQTVANGDVITLGDTRIKVIHTPGHSKGSVCYLAGNTLFTGDTLFDGGYGRFDLHGGHFETLCLSLKSLKTLDRDLDILAGHGSGAKLGEALDLLNFI